MMGIVLTFKPDDGADAPQRERGLETRGFLAIEAALLPWSDSTLIACLASADPWDREAILAELEARRATQPGRGVAAESGACGVEE